MTDADPAFFNWVEALSDEELIAQLRTASEEAHEALEEQRRLAYRRNVLAWTLHGRGYSYADISRLLGVARSRAQKMVEEGRP